MSLKKKLNSNDNNQLFMCIHDSGGTGKSYVAEIITQLVNLKTKSDYELMED